ncbi:hypothetical protein RchiOBHm_Chr1g0369111 [Rosa chinensis]|uniref:Uncharacterized protein n=1 Tax=Rosa chinensis TaxID=74649 RepID=A0A2P6SKZ0_ROSCH|nr:hypothetical protein RchiOBHm_Chr1g0369111 [Rosa chinensis]
MIMFHTSCTLNDGRKKLENRRSCRSLPTVLDKDPDNHRSCRSLPAVLEKDRDKHSNFWWDFLRLEGKQVGLS